MFGVGSSGPDRPMIGEVVVRLRNSYYRRMSMITRMTDEFARSAQARDVAPAAALFHSLSDPTRLAILQHLTLGEQRVRDLTEHLGLVQSTVSGHLACLKDCGLVTSRPEGRASVFSLATASELLDVLGAAERLLAATGNAVELCPNYGAGTSANRAAEDLKMQTMTGNDQ